MRKEYLILAAGLTVIGIVILVVRFATEVRTEESYYSFGSSVYGCRGAIELKGNARAHNI
jgi:hypothetical protein